MVFTVKYSFTFSHEKHVRVILCDLSKDNYISPCLVERLSQHPEAGSFCYYKENHFIIQFGLREFIGGVTPIFGAMCYLDKNVLMGHPVILGKKWLVGRNVNINRTFNILQICDWKIYYHFQVKSVDTSESKKDI